jgi:hypothetical protein
MARKTTEGVPPTKRIKKAATPVPPAAAQVSAEPAKEVRKNGKQGGFVSANLEEAIRRRAYELYLERRATAGGEIGDENQDWLIAEREILSNNGGHGQHPA